MEGGTVLGRVDMFAREHPVDPAGEIGGARQLVHQRHGLGGDTLFGVVVEQVFVPEGEPVKAIGIAGEEIAKMERGHAVAVLFQRRPCTIKARRRSRRSVHGVPSL